MTKNIQFLSEIWDIESTQLCSELLFTKQIEIPMIQEEDSALSYAVSSNVQAQLCPWYEIPRSWILGLSIREYLQFYST